MGRGLAWVVAAGMLSLAVGCSHVQEIPDVDEEWVARLSEGELAAIRAAEEAHRAQAVELERAKVALAAAQQRLQISRSLMDAAEAKYAAAGKRRELARDRDDARGVAAAERELAARTLELDEVEALGELRRAEEDEARARVSAWEAELEARDVELTRERYLALRQVGDTRVAGMDLSTFDDGVAARQEEVRESYANLSRKQEQVAVFQDRWIDARQRRAAASRPTPTG